MRLWLLRHARVELPAGICYGSSDIAADAYATTTAASAFGHCPSAGSAIVSSPLLRARELADALHRVRPDLLPPCFDIRLREMDFGTWELQPWEQIPRLAMQAWTDDFPNHRFGERESAQDVIDRVASALDDLIKSGHQETVWVTHAGVIRALIFLKAGKQQIQSAAEWPLNAPAMGQAISLEF